LTGDNVDHLPGDAHRKRDAAARFHRGVRGVTGLLLAAEETFGFLAVSLLRRSDARKMFTLSRQAVEQ
jgi:hypothetical protein